MNILEYILDIIKKISEFGSLLEGIANLSIIVIVIMNIRGWTYRMVELSIGSFHIRRRDFNVQNITNLVSLHFYGGGVVPEPIRQEILKKTTPKIKKVSDKREMPPHDVDAEQPN